LILETKLNKPRVSKDLLPRTHLLEKLNRNRDTPLILVSAPTAYGKSMLISNWIDSQNYDYGWLSIDESMNKSSAFLTYFTEAIKKSSKSEIAAFDDIHQNSHFLSTHAFINKIINTINALDKRVRLVIDDYHIIENPEIHNLINALIQEPIKDFQLIIITRRDPPFQMNKLKLYKRLLEIRMRDLKFNLNELSKLVNLNDSLSLSEQELKEINERTEGWILGIRMFLVAGKVPNKSNEKKNLDFFINDITNLIDHNVQQLDSKLFRQITICSLFDEFNKDMVNAIFKIVLKESEIIDNFFGKLKASNLFLIPLDNEGNWYRFHHLIKKDLSNRIHKSEPDLVNAIYNQISKWYYRNNNIEHAIQYAIKGGNYKLACDEINKSRMLMLNKDRWWVVQAWLESIPQEIKNSNFDLLLAQLWVCEDNWNLKEIPHILKNLESQGVMNSDSKTKSEYLLHLGYQHLFVKINPKKALDHLEDSKSLYSDYNMFGARRELYLATARQMMGTSETALRSLHNIEKEFKPTHLMSLRGNIANLFVLLLDGDLSLGEQKAEQFVFSIRGIEFPAIEGFSWYFQGNIAFQKCHKERLIHSFSNALNFENKLNYRVFIDALGGLILCQSLHHDKETSDSDLQKLKDTTSKLKNKGFFIYYESINARAKWHNGLGAGELKWALSNWEKPSPENYFFMLDIPSLTKIRIIISHGSMVQVTEALRDLLEIETILDKLNNRYHSIDITLLKSIALMRLDRKEQAKEFLEKALHIVEKNNLFRPLMEVFRVVPNLFNLVEPSKIKQRVLTRISLNLALKQIPTLSSSRNDQITPREQEIIGLIALGMTNKEIAEKLHISIVTVKSHLTNIYRKLQVRNRTSMLRKVRNEQILS